MDKSDIVMEVEKQRQLVRSAVVHVTGKEVPHYKDRKAEAHRRINMAFDRILALVFRVQSSSTAEPKS